MNVLEDVEARDEEDVASEAVDEPVEEGSRASSARARWYRADDGVSGVSSSCDGREYWP